MAERSVVGGVGGFLLGVVFAAVVFVAGVYLYLRSGHPPVATADAPFAMEAKVVDLPLHARIERELRQAPFAADDAGLVAGAHVYVQECASCHGTPGHDSGYLQSMYPSPPQLWHRHHNGTVVGVSDDETGETYWKVANGIRLSGMPSFDHRLSETEMWQVSLLLKSADQPLSPAVTGILAAGGPGASAAVR